MKTLLCGFVLLATGCVAKQGGTIGRSDSQAAGDALGNGVEDSAASFGPVNAGATVDASCVTAGGDTSDPDQDTIPANGTLTFNCTAMALGYTGTLTGTETIKDDQPNAVAWAFTAMGDFHATLTGPFGGTIVRDWDGSIVATQSSALGPFALDRTLDAVTVFDPPGEGPDGRTTTVTEDNDWTVTFTPQVSWTPGGVIVTGSVTATGSWIVDVEGRTAQATLATPTPLTLTPSCQTRITAGTVTGTYQDGARTATISVTWTACGQRTVNYTEQ